VFVSAGDVFSTFTAPVRRGFQVIFRELSRAPHENELRRLIPSLSSTVDALAGENGQLQSAVRNAARTLDAVTVGDAGPLDRSLATLPGTLAEVTAAGQNLVGILDHADVTAGSLRRRSSRSHRQRGR
jgi:ABC-type transporter Mla subunit MlaD